MIMREVLVILLVENGLNQREGNHIKRRTQPQVKGICETSFSSFCLLTLFMYCFKSCAVLAEIVLIRASSEYLGIFGKINLYFLHYLIGT